MRERNNPSGTVTFLFTDIEGSTQRWERDRAAMQEAVRRHDAILRSAIEANEGFVFKTIGDAFCAAFGRAEAAVLAAVAAQRLLSAGDFAAVDGVRVRMALHTGTADERDGDFFGPSVNRVARLLSIGHGGQVLLSGTTTELVRRELSAGHSLRDMGTHRLKGIAQPERVYQLLAPDLGDTFPALLSLDSRPNNLPVALTSFVGRVAETKHVVELMAENRFVTLTGPGGVGKSRLALEVAAELLGAFRDGVWLVELASLAEASFVAATAASELGLALSPSRSPDEALIEHLAGKNLLLVLDNCEHLVAGVANLAERILRSSPLSAILATSREPLGVAGERQYRTPELGFPAERDSLAAAEAPTDRSKLWERDSNSPRAWRWIVTGTSMSPTTTVSSSIRHRHS
jgi:class 3 adenylate cyclase